MFELHFFSAYMDRPIWSFIFSSTLKILRPKLFTQRSFKIRITENYLKLSAAFLFILFSYTDKYFSKMLFFNAFRFFLALTLPFTRVSLILIVFFYGVKASAFLISKCIFKPSFFFMSKSRL